MSDGGWIGVDLDGTLAEYHGWVGEIHVGEPIPEMVRRVKHWLAQGWDVRIFTARVSGDRYAEAAPAVQEWCREHIGQVLPITNVKDFGMIVLYDDRVVTVEQNTGRCLAPEQPRFTP